MKPAQPPKIDLVSGNVDHFHTKVNHHFHLVTIGHGESRFVEQPSNVVITRALNTYTVFTEF